MKKNLFIVLVILFLSNNFLKCLEYSEQPLFMSGLIDMKYYNNKIYVLGGKYIVSLDDDYSIIKYFDGNKWDSLPTKYIRGNEEMQLQSHSFTKINIDSSGNVWLSGKSLLCYKDNKWNEYFIDDTNKDYREYTDFCIDKYNNVWVNTHVYKKKAYAFSEIFKFDGIKFSSVIKSNYIRAFDYYSDDCRSNSIVALSDGRICLIRGFFPSYNDPDFDPEYKDLYFFNQDLSYTQTKLQVNYGSKYSTLTKMISNIYPESNEKLWFCTDRLSWSSDGVTVNMACCSGLYLYEKSNWTLFNEDNGLDYVNSADSGRGYRIIYNIQRISPEKYLIIAAGTMYLMGNDYRLKRINTIELGNNAKLIRASEYGNSYEQEFTMLYNYDYGGLSDPGAIIPFNGEIWLMTTVGILVFKEDAITSVDDERQTNENESALYPNPAKDILNIQDYSQYSNYEIYDLLGKKVSSGDLSKNYIDVNSLANGNYYIILHTNNKTYQIKYFVKE